MVVETISYGLRRKGGSEANETWKNTPGNMEKKVIRGLRTKMTKMRVKKIETGSKCHLRSVQFFDSIGSKLKLLGKLASNPAELIPFREVPGYSDLVPVIFNSPQPPKRLEITPACRAASQMNESAR